MNKDVLFTSCGSSKISLLTTNDEVEMFKDLSPSSPFTLHVSDNDII